MTDNTVEKLIQGTHGPSLSEGQELARNTPVAILEDEIRRRHSAIYEIRKKCPHPETHLTKMGTTHYYGVIGKECKNRYICHMCGKDWTVDAEDGMMALVRKAKERRHGNV